MTTVSELIHYTQYIIPLCIIPQYITYSTLYPITLYTVHYTPVHYTQYIIPLYIIPLYIIVQKMRFLEWCWTSECPEKLMISTWKVVCRDGLSYITRWRWGLLRGRRWWWYKQDHGFQPSHHTFQSYHARLLLLLKSIKLIF